jgi:hypothetical protein
MVATARRSSARYSPLPGLPKVPSQQIFQEKGSQGLDCGLIKRGEKATERRACRQTIASKERHEGCCPGLQPLVECFEGLFTACGIAQEHGHKVNDLITTEASPGKANVLGDSIEDSLLPQIPGHEHYFSKPGRR